ncbi:ATP-dependent DNA helicase II subunit 1 [Turnera subulata]|uniref:ATP-dependent DNA helicase II subunit 1 n=1 Tax=Turnera subulata TaxID=218843 RepID=A0A9Q0FVH5_9ROSI|nr:ATP-dependent DNA helicase II subunit 1 [Turnera subulata]
MELDPDDVFKDEEDGSDSEFYQQRESSKEFVVYLVDASPKMFSSICRPSDGGEDDDKAESHFQREKKNLQDLNGVFVYNVAERDYLDRPTARLIKHFEQIEESFTKEIGSQYGIVSGSRENSLYNALWVAQALLRKGSAKTASKRILLFTNEDDPFGSITGVAKTDMTRTTMQRAKDAQDLGISIELLPLSPHHDEEFNVSLFYADLLGVERDELAQFVPSAGQKLQDMKDQLRKRMFAKRIVRRITMLINNGLSVEVNLYALIRPTVPGAITWLDSVSNRPLKTERSFICADTGALLQEPTKRYHPYKNEDVKFSVEELSNIKRVAPGTLRLLGFKPLSCLKDFHNLRPSTFIFPSDKEVIGSTCIFIALFRSMLRLKRFAVAFYGSTSHPQLVALVAQDEIISAGGQVEPPGMHMIYLPYSDDLHSENVGAPRATDEQIEKAAALVKRIDLKNFSVCQFANPGLQRHYAVLQALALEEDEMPEINDETLPDEEGMARPGIVKAIEEFKFSVYGDQYDGETDSLSSRKESETSKKRKAAAAEAAKEYANYDWTYLADNGQLKDLTVNELKCYLMRHNLPVAGKKEALIGRILTHMGK